ncbi:extracellular solute-binding protein [Patescibacteria group bacterium]|nr:MAG: extracellular solute-binding protein [Patescibacteria group bacterium]
MTFSKRSIAGALLTALVLTGQGCGGPSAAEVAATKPVTLTVWRVFDTANTMRDIMDAYTKVHTNVSFKYVQLRPEEYRDELLRAFAEGKGPDIFSVHNDGMGEFKSLMAPLPATLKIPYTTVTGSVKKEKVTVIREDPTITPREVRRDFLDVVAGDVVLPFQATQNAPTEEKVYGLPLFVDTMALYVNRDLLNAAGIAEPPVTWDEFQAAVMKLTKVGPNNEIIQSGAALGTGANVERAFDILSVLMMQNGTQMTDSRGNPTFGSYETPAHTNPGQDAVRFYTDFANPTKEVYGWNAQQPNSFDAFVAGKTAFFFGYAYHLPRIRARAPKMNVEVSPMPQIKDSRAVNMANYWIETVSKASKNQNFAWDFVQFAASAEQVPSYLKAAARPTARRALIQSQVNDEDLAVFVGQLLTAKDWYRGADAATAEAAFEKLIDDVLAGMDVEDAIKSAQNRVIQTL